jgi:hypothetical protein
VGYGIFSTKSKKYHTPRQSGGTLLRAFFVVRKQSPPQVTPVEGGVSQVFDFVENLRNPSAA